MTPARTIQWAPRVTPGRIRRLYGLDKLGIHDEALLARVGWGLHARCRDALTVHRAMRGEVPCPECGEIVARPTRRRGHAGPPNRSARAFPCPECGWQATWRQYREAMRNRPLCFDCLRVLDWQYSRNLLRCPSCGREWTWRQYLRSLRGRVRLPCPHCRMRVRRPEHSEQWSVASTTEEVDCPKCGADASHAGGKLSCAHCGYEIAWRNYRKRQKRRVERLRCASCGHQFTWQSWRDTYRHDSLLTGNPAPLSRFLREWPQCSTPQQQMIRIDALLHAVHGRGALGPVLIEGDEPTVMALLDDLAGLR